MDYVGMTWMEQPPILLPECLLSKGVTVSDVYMCMKHVLHSEGYKEI